VTLESLHQPLNLRVEDFLFGNNWNWFIGIGRTSRGSRLLLKQMDASAPEANFSILPFVSTVSGQVHSLISSLKFSRPLFKKQEHGDSRPLHGPNCTLLLCQQVQHETLE
jgi:hypothetical protein